MSSHSNNYFEPNKPPEDVIAKSKEKRKLKIRFKDKDAVIEFCKRTGIGLIHGKNNTVQFPVENTLMDMF